MDIYRKGRNYRVVIVLTMIAILLVATPLYYITAKQFSTNTIISPSNTHHKTKTTVIGSPPTQPIWNITQDTIVYGENIKVDEINLYPKTTLTLINCTLSPLSEDYTWINFNNFTYLYIYNSTIIRIQMNGKIGQYPDQKILFNYTIKNTIVFNSNLGYQNRVGFFGVDKYVANINISKSKIYNSTMWLSFYTTPSDYYNITIESSYLYNFSGYLYVNPEPINPSAIIIKNTIIDGKTSIPKFDYVNFADIDSTVDIAKTPYLFIHTRYDTNQDNLIVNIDNVVFSNLNYVYFDIYTKSTISNVIFDNDGIVMFIGNEKVYNIVMKSTVQSGYFIATNYGLLTKSSIEINNGKIDTTLFVGVRRGYMYVKGDTRVNDKYAQIKLSNLYISNLKTAIDGSLHMIRNQTTIIIDECTIDTASIVANESYVVYEVILVPYHTIKHNIRPNATLYINHSQIGNLYVDNITDVQIRNSYIDGYAIMTKSTCTLYSTKFNYLNSVNSRVEILYKLTIHAISGETTLTKIYNRINTLVKYSGQKQFSVYIKAIDIYPDDNVTYYYPYTIKIETLSSSQQYIINPLNKDEYILTYIGRYILEMALPKGKLKGWVFIPLHTQTPMMASEILKLNTHIKLIVYEIAGNQVVYGRWFNNRTYKYEIIGNDFEIRPYTSIYVYLDTQSITVTLPVYAGQFNDTTLKLHFGWNYIAVPQTTTVSNIFAKNQFISEIVVYHNGTYTLYNKFQQFRDDTISPTDAIMVYSTTNARYFII